MAQPLLVKEVDGDRYYTHRGIDYPSVTSIIKHGVAKPNLMKWMADQIIDVAIAKRLVLAQHESDKEARKLLVKASEVYRNEAAGIGTSVHTAVEQYALGGRVEKPEGIEGYVQSFDNFLYDWKPTFILTEALVISKAYGFAGTLDSLVEIGGKRKVLDVKSGKWVWPEVALQLAAYSRADIVVDRTTGAETELSGLSKGALVLHLRPDGYELRRVRTDDTVFDAFLAAIDMFHWSMETSKSVLGPAETPE